MSLLCSLTWAVCDTADSLVTLRAHGRALLAFWYRPMSCKGVMWAAGRSKQKDSASAAWIICIQCILIGAQTYNLSLGPGNAFLYVQSVTCLGRRERLQSESAHFFLLKLKCLQPTICDSIEHLYLVTPELSVSLHLFTDPAWRHASSYASLRDDRVTTKPHNERHFFKYFSWIE